MRNRLEIRLYEENHEMVSLSGMSAKAVESFIAVVNALKELAVGTVSEDSLIFSIEEGSALVAVGGIEPVMSVIYSEIDTAIQGQSEKKHVTDNLRIIQSELKKNRLRYQFNYLDSDSNNVIDLHDQLINIKRISLKRQPKSQITHELKIIKGFFNQIGGKEPNYHFDYGEGNKLTIECSMDQAKSINKHLYTEVNSLLLSKKWTNNRRKEELTHKVVLIDELVAPLKQFFTQYNAEENLVDKLSITHDFIDQQFLSNPLKLELLAALLVAFNDKNFHLSELKTLLVISKPFKHNDKIDKERVDLLETYTEKKNQ